MSLYEEYQEIICTSNNVSIQEATENVRTLSDLTARFNVYIIENDFKSNQEFARTHALRLSWVMDRKNCGVPFPDKPEYQDASPSIFSKIGNIFKTKPKCDAEETQKAILNSYAEKVADSLFKSLTVDEVKSNISLTKITSSNDESETASCKAEIQVKMDKGFEEVLFTNRDKVFQALTNIFMDNSGINSVIVPTTANTAVSNLLLKKAFNTGLNDMGAEKMRENLISELETWNVPISYTVKQANGLETNLKITDEDLAFTSGSILSYTKNGMELLKVMKQKSDSTAPAASSPASSESAAASPTPAASATTSASPTVVASALQTASFDCSKASSSQEKLICSTPALGEADIKLSQTYKAALQKSSNPDQLKKEQISWMKNVRNSCTDQSCLLNAINNRIVTLTN